MLTAVQKLAFVAIAVGKEVDATAILLITLKLAFIALAVFKGERTLTLKGVV